MPKECKDLRHNTESFVFDRDWVVYLVMAALFVNYMIGSSYFFFNRNKISFMTRSPLTVAISLFLLGADAICNTLIYSDITAGNIFHWQCNLGIITTVFGQFGFMLAISLRIYRISKVYNTYLSVLAN